MLLGVVTPKPELNPVPISGREESEEKEVTVEAVEVEEKGIEIELLILSSWFNRWCVSRRLLLAAVKSSAFLSAASFSRLSWASCSGKEGAPPSNNVSVEIVTDGVPETEGGADVETEEVAELEGCCEGEGGRGGRREGWRY